MKLYLDDVRTPPRTQMEAEYLLSTGKVELISFDHDLGENAGSGYGVACHIEWLASKGQLAPLEAAMKSAERIWERMEMMS